MTAPRAAALLAAAFLACAGPARADSASAGATDILAMDLKGWAGGADAAYWPRRHALETALLEAPEEETPDRRLALVRFHLAYGEGAEALGHLETLTGTALQPAARSLLAGAARMQAGQVTEALRALSIPALAHDRHARLWRALAAVRRGDWQGAGRELAALGPKALGGVLALYPEAFAEELLAGAARAATLTADAALARLLGETGRVYPLPPVASARVALVVGDTGAARQALAGAEVAEGPNGAAEAAYLRLALRDAPMSGRRAALHGLARDAEGSLAAEIWAAAAEQARRDGAPLAAFEAAARARATAPPGPWRQALAHAAADDLGHLLLPGPGDAVPLSPIAAAELVLAHRDLVEGAPNRLGLLEGFAGTLSRLGLPDAAARVLMRAADLPEARPQGPCLALRAARAALAAGDPERALTWAARAEAGAHPQEDRHAARLLGARALAAAGRTDEALAAIGEADAGDVASLLAVRAEIAWQGEAWGEAADAANTLLVQRAAYRAGETGAAGQDGGPDTGTLARRAAVALIRSGARADVVAERLAPLPAQAGARDGPRIDALAAVLLGNAEPGSAQDIRVLRAALETLSQARP
ncbi:hypothetical protein [Futiania mangrovi]|uniref:Tetratricopeptide repeat protein n=1 Tax=Futiania mangrovi TaxID=2959716 RepID=A0A9J6PBF0_9PROT|nr:hypothetical protein [Futiania mangrovii]MCP1335040.1 hypothetical protein [Futiania mangrovii]